jgi:uncharacterized membrane protein
MRLPRHRTRDEAEDPAVDIFAQNIQTVADLVARREARLSPGQRFIESLTQSIGRPRFLYINLAFIAVWMLGNSGLYGRPFDKPPFFWLCTVLAVEAILVTGMVLISQNRQRLEADRRTQLDLQINLLSEQKITKMLSLLEQLVEAQTQAIREDPEVEAMKESADPEVLLTALEFAMEQANVGPETQPYAPLSPEEAETINDVRDALAVANDHIQAVRETNQEG